MKCHCGTIMKHDARDKRYCPRCQPWIEIELLKIRVAELEAKNASAALSGGEGEK